MRHATRRPSFGAATISRPRSPGRRRGSSPMRRTAAVALVPAIVIAAAWLRLEQPHGDPSRAAAVAALALAPALVRGVWPRLAALLVAFVLAARLTLGLSFHHPGRFGSRF